MQDWKIEADRIAAENEADLLAQYTAAWEMYQQQVADLKANSEAMKLATLDENGNLTVRS